MNEIFLYTLKKAKRLIVGVVGATILLLGIAMIVLPGPAFIVIPLGLGVLATEFVWARNLIKKVKQQINKNKKGNLFL
ncbi:MAG: PGPGW domain-containing protein [Nitrospirota bacterium]